LSLHRDKQDKAIIETYEKYSDGFNTNVKFIESKEYNKKEADDWLFRNNKTKQKKIKEREELLKKPEYKRMDIGDVGDDFWNIDELMDLSKIDTDNFQIIKFNFENYKNQTKIIRLLPNIHDIKKLYIEEDGYIKCYGIIDDIYSIIYFSKNIFDWIIKNSMQSDIKPFLPFSLDENVAIRININEDSHAISDNMKFVRDSGFIIFDKEHDNLKKHQKEITDFLNKSPVNLEDSYDNLKLIIDRRRKIKILQN
jgi:hypothetical protein